MPRGPGDDALNHRTCMLVTLLLYLPMASYIEHVIAPFPVLLATHAHIKEASASKRVMSSHKRRNSNSAENMFRIAVSVLALSGMISAAIASPLPVEGEKRPPLSRRYNILSCVMHRVRAVNDSEAKCRYPVAPYELVDCDMLLKGAGKGAPSAIA